MEEKYCYRCKDKKFINKFYKDRSRKDGFKCSCIKCSKEQREIYRKTFNGLSSIIYNQQKRTSKNRNHPLPDYTLIEFKEWFKSQPDFEELFKNWKDSGYKKDLRPSADRKDDYKPYTLDNLRLTTWKNNNKRSHEDMKNGINNKQSKAVIQCDLNGNKIDEYYSMSNAERITSVNTGKISMCCNGKRKTAGGFIWKSKH